MIAGHSRRVKSSALRGQRIVSLSKRDFDNKLNAPGVTLPIFSSQDHATPSYTRSTTCWAKDIDLTCCSPWNSFGGDGAGGGPNQRAGTLISPRHVIFASHYLVPGSNTIRFITMDNTVITRTITSVVDLEGNASGLYMPDIAIGVLDTDVPIGITYATILAEPWDKTLRGLLQLPAVVPPITGKIWKYDSMNIPVLYLDQEEKALVSEISKITDMRNPSMDAALHWAAIEYKTSSSAVRQLFFENVISGDSGNPAFLIIRNKPVLLSVWTSGGAGAGSFVNAWRSDINAAMTTLGGGYQLTSVSLK